MKRLTIAIAATGLLVTAPLAHAQNNGFTTKGETGLFKAPDGGALKRPKQKGFIVPGEAENLTKRKGSNITYDGNVPKLKNRAGQGPLQHRKDKKRRNKL